MHGKLLYGVALQRLGRQLSAQREFEAAARLAPGDPEAQVAAAVGRFDKADPSRAFSRLGPLAQRYPGSQSVRFHLGLSLLWLGSVKKAKAELRLARDAGSTTPLGPRRAGSWSASRESGPAETKMGRSAYGVRPLRLQQCRLLDGVPWFDGTPADG